MLASLEKSGLNAGVKKYREYKCKTTRRNGNRRAKRKLRKKQQGQQF